MKRTLALLAGLAGLAERIGTALQWLSPAVARLTVGLVFLQSGWGKLHDLEKVTNYFTQLDKLSDMLAKMKGPNPHGEFFGSPVGREIL